MPADPLWHQLDLARPAYADVQPIVSEHTQHNARVRTYALPNSELRVVVKGLEVLVHLPQCASSRARSTGRGCL